MFSIFDQHIMDCEEFGDPVFPNMLLMTEPCMKLSVDITPHEQSLLHFCE